MKVVLDTNVVVSGIFFGGVSGEVLEAWAETRFELCLSPLIIDEYLRTCDRLASLRRTLAHQEVLAALLAHGSLVADDITREPVTVDPDDDKFIICASKAGAIVVSGDRDLLASVHPERHSLAILQRVRSGCRRPGWVSRRREFAAMGDANSVMVGLR